MIDKSTEIEIPEYQSFEESCRHLGKLLGLDAPVSEDVMIAALAHPNYAHNLLLSRNTPPKLSQMLNNPPVVPARVETTLASVGNAELVKKATAAMLRWALTYFARVDEETRCRRMAACQECEHFTDAPRKLIYRIAGAAADENGRRLCGLCGCVVARKVVVPTEWCPAPHPIVPGLTRWGELAPPHV